MVTERNDRIYLDHLEKIINAYKQHNSHDLEKRLTIGNIFNTSDTNTLVTRISDNSIYDRNITTMMNFGHSRTRDYFKKLDSKSIKTFKKIHSVDEVMKEYKDDDKASDILFEKFRSFLITSYNLKIDIAGFFANVIAYYPSQYSVKTWIKDCSNKITIEEINIAAIKLCSQDINIDYHLLTCTSCIKYVRGYKDNDKDINNTECYVHERDVICSSNYNPILHPIVYQTIK